MKQVIWLLIFTLMIVSCSKQETPKFNSEIKLSDSDLQQMRDCLGFRPYDQQLLHAGTKKLFECNKWNTQFPSLYSAVSRIDAKTWNYLMGPLDAHFFTEVEGRKLFLSQLKKLDQEKGLDDLGKVGRLFFESPVIKLLAKEENKGAWIEILKILKLQPEKKEIIFQFFKAFTKTISKSEQSLKKNLHPVFKLEKAKEHKDWIFDFLAKRYSEGKLNQDINVLAEFFNKNSNDLWFPGFVKNPNMTAEKFNQIFTYSAFKGTNVRKDVRFLKKTLNTGLTCVQKEQSNFVDVKPEIASIINFLAHSNREEFFLKQLDHKSKLLIFTNFCSEIIIDGEKSDEFVPAFERLFDNVQDFFSDRDQFEWLRGLHSSAETVTKNPFYFVDFLAGSFFERLENLSILLREEETEGLFPALFDLFRNIPLQDYPHVYRFFHLLEDESLRTQIGELAKLWLSLNADEKQKIYNLAEVFMEQGFHTSEILDKYVSTFSLFPQLTENLKQSYLENDNTEKLWSALQQLALELSQPQTLRELQYFYSEKHMIQMVYAITFGLEAAPLQNTFEQNIEDAFLPYVYPENDRKIQMYMQCVSDVRALEGRGMGYYDLITNYPPSCMKIEDGAVTHKLFVWFKTIDAIYASQFGDQYVLFDSKGFLKNESLSQILNLMLVINDSYLKSNEGASLRDLLYDLKKEIVQKKNYKLVEPVLSILGRVFQENDSRLLGYHNHLVKTLTSVSDEKIKNFLLPLSDYVVELKQFKEIQESDANKLNCKHLSPNLGVNPCLNKQEIKAGLRKLWFYVFRRMDDAPPMLEELVSLLHPQGGVEIPYPGKKGSKHTITVEEIVRFFHHMSETSTHKVIEYKTQSSSKIEAIDNLSQLEIVIRDIGFLNDFYGAFFKNTVAGAKNYKKEVTKLQKQVNLMVNMGSFFRSTKVFPRETEWKLTNIQQAYPSLIAVDDDYKLGDKNYRYGPMMQSILAMVTKTSAKDVQKFTAFWLPNEDFGNRHNGLFLTEFVNISGMRHIAQFIKNRFGDDIGSAIKDARFQRVNSLASKFSLDKLKTTVRVLADRYAKNDQDVFYQMSDDLVDWIDTLSYQELRTVEKTLLNLLLISTYTEAKNMDSLLDLVEYIFSTYNTMKKAWPEDRKLIEVVQDLLPLSEIMIERLENNPQDRVWINQVFGLMKTALLEQNLTGIDLLVQSFRKNPELWIKDLLDLIDAGRKFGASWELSEAKQFDQTFSLLLGHPHLSFQGLKSWLASGLTDRKHEMELLRLSAFLTQTISYEGQKRTRFYVALDQLLNKESRALEDLLRTASSVFSFK